MAVNPETDDNSVSRAGPGPQTRLTPSSQISGLPGGSAVTNPPANLADGRDTGSIPGSGKVPWRSHFFKCDPLVFLPGKSCGHRSLAGYSPWGRKGIRHNLATKEQEPRSVDGTETSPDVHTGFLGPSSRLGASGHLLPTPSSILSAPLRAVGGGGHQKLHFRWQYPRVKLATPLPAHDPEVVTARVDVARPPQPLALAPGGPGSARAALTAPVLAACPSPSLSSGARGHRDMWGVVCCKLSGPRGQAGDGLPWGEFWARPPWPKLCPKVCLPSCFGVQLRSRSDTPSRSDAVSGPS